MWLFTRPGTSAQQLILTNFPQAPAIGRMWLESFQFRRCTVSTTSSSLETTARHWMPLDALGLRTPSVFTVIGSFYCTRAEGDGKAWHSGRYFLYELPSSFMLHVPSTSGNKKDTSFRAYIEKKSPKGCGLAKPTALKPYPLPFWGC